MRAICWFDRCYLWRLEIATKEEVIHRIEKIDEIRTILDDIRRSEMTELEEVEDARSA